jgi:hypothetical protein
MATAGWQDVRRACCHWPLHSNALLQQCASGDAPVRHNLIECEPRAACPVLELHLDGRLGFIGTGIPACCRDGTRHLRIWMCLIVLPPVIIKHDGNYVVVGLPQVLALGLDDYAVHTALPQLLPSKPLFPLLYCLSVTLSVSHCRRWPSCYAGPFKLVRY